ncbi:MAG: PilZ domain-containing protein [Planctomycetota bacterium]|jgi:c-di-GMP-binding flagellar brake protein YcgR
MQENGHLDSRTPEGGESQIADRRRHLRFLDEVKVRYRDIEGSDPSAWGRSRDLSMGGLGLVTQRPMLVGCHLAMEIHVDSEPAPIVALGRVVRVSEERTEESSAAGVEFLWLSVEDRANLERLAEYFRKKYGTIGDLADPSGN